MEYSVTHGDQLPFEDYKLNPNELNKVIPSAVFDHLKDMKKFTDDHAVMKSGHKVAGGSGDIKIIARFPQGVILKLEQEFPGFLNDKKMLHKMLSKYPIYAAYSRKAFGGAS